MNAKKLDEIAQLLEVRTGHYVVPDHGPTVPDGLDNSYVVVRKGPLWCVYHTQQESNKRRRFFLMKWRALDYVALALAKAWVAENPQ